MMVESVVTVAVVVAAGVWFVRRLRRTARGETGCSCGNCGKKDCPSR